MFNNRYTILTFLLSAILFTGCITSDSYQSQKSIKDGKWQSRYIPEFTFDIEDTASAYFSNILLRHDDAYPYSNIWLKLYLKEPGDSMYTDSFQLDVLLADKEGYWLGNEQGSMWMHKIRIDHRSLSRFTKKGKYSIKIKQLMRQDPLPSILNIGLRIDRKKT